MNPFPRNCSRYAKFSRRVGSVTTLLLGLSAALAIWPVALAQIAAAVPASASAVKLPPGVVLAQVPWKRDSDHPVKEFVPLATLPWADCDVVHLSLPHAPRQGGAPDCHFIMAMCRDKQGNLWLATEGGGIYRYDPSASKGKHWTQFTKQNTHGALANNCIYAIACDNHNRIWAGELNHGVSVYNGKQWQDYDIVQNPKHTVLAGPLGDHVFAMKFDPFTDQMWIGTNAGVSIYQCSGPKVGAIRHHWHYITQANGLPMNPDAIAFGNGGIIYVGTQCSGLAVGTPLQGPRTKTAIGCGAYQWKIIKGPWHLPVTATGSGLPGNLINSVATTWANHLVIATDDGIALGRLNDGSKSASPLNLTFEQGQDFPAKVLGLWHPPLHWQAPSGVLLETLPMQDYTTAAAWQAARNSTGPNAPSGDAGYLWLGHRQKGLDVWQYNARGKIIQRWHIYSPQVGNYIESLQPLHRNVMAVGTYGNGLFIVTLPGRHKGALPEAPRIADKAATAAEPQGARPPNERELTAIATAIRMQLISAKSQKQPRIVPLPDDWRTEGSWLGHYGKYWMCLFAAGQSIGDIVWGPGPRALNHFSFMGPHHLMGDSLRYWIQWLYTDNPRVLRIPPVYYQEDAALHAQQFVPHEPRREAEINDSGDGYAPSWQGPDVNVLMHIPPGRFVLALYEYNYNGHYGTCRHRDYVLGFRCLSSKLDLRKLSFRGGFATTIYSYPERMVGRVANFRGGVWKRFLVRGPMVLVVRVGRNSSFNAMLNGAALDTLHEHPEPYYYGMSQWATRSAALASHRHKLLRKLAGKALGAPSSAMEMPRGVTVSALLNNAELELYESPQAWAKSAPLVYTLALRRLMGQFGGRAKAASPAEMRIAARLEYRLNMFSRWQRLEKRLGIITPREIEQSIKWNRLNATYRYLEFAIIRKAAAALAADAAHAAHHKGLPGAHGSAVLPPS